MEEIHEDKSPSVAARDFNAYLSLEEVSRDDLGAVAVQEGEGSAESGSGHTPKNGLGDNSSPAGLSLVDGYRNQRSD